MTLADLNEFAAARGVDPAHVKIKVWVEYEETTICHDLTLEDAKLTGAPEHAIIQLDVVKDH